ncbi:hypothetical protein D3C80_2137970 [compost metagenome]
MPGDHRQIQILRLWFIPGGGHLLCERRPDTGNDRFFMYLVGIADGIISVAGRKSRNTKSHGNSKAKIPD